MVAIARLKQIKEFEGFVYFTGEQSTVAERLKKQIAQMGFNVKISSDVIHKGHSEPALKLTFLADEFSVIVPWLMLNNQKLSVVVVPVTSARKTDFKKRAFWLGQKLPIDVSHF